MREPAAWPIRLCVAVAPFLFMIPPYHQIRREYHFNCSPKTLHSNFHLRLICDVCCDTVFFPNKSATYLVWTWCVRIVQNWQ